MNRREHIAALLAMAAMLLPPGQALALEERMEEVVPQFGLIGQISTLPGKRAELAALLLEGSGGMPGNMGYVVGEDSADPDALWVVEVWETEQAHKDSLALPAVKAAIARARPIIAGFGARHQFRPIGRA